MVCFSGVRDEVCSFVVLCNTGWSFRLRQSQLFLHAPRRQALVMAHAARRHGGGGGIDEANECPKRLEPCALANVFSLRLWSYLYSPPPARRARRADKTQPLVWCAPDAHCWELSCVQRRETSNKVVAALIMAVHCFVETGMHDFWWEVLGPRNRLSLIELIPAGLFILFFS